MRTINEKQARTLLNPLYKVACRVWVKDSTGTWRDLSNLEGYNWILSVEYGENLDQHVANATVTLWRNLYYMNLAPLMESSKFNRSATGAYATMIDINREIKIETATIPDGVKPFPEDWQNVFEGIIDQIDWGGSQAEVKLNCRDLGARLQDQFIEAERVYGGDEKNPIASEQVIQQILNDNETGVTLTIINESEWAIKAYTQSREPVMQALQNIAQQRGWSVRYKWLNGWCLTYYEPDRVKTVPDYIVTPSHYFEISRLSLDLTKIRTVVKVIYGEDAEGGRPFVEYPETGKVAAATSTTLTDSSKKWGNLTGRKVTIVKGKGAGQERVIKSNTAQTLTIATWDATPDTTSRYAIVEGLDTASPLIRYGRRYMEIAENSTSQVDTLDEAYKLARNIYLDLSSPAAEQEISTRYFYPIELGDFYEFKPNGVHYDQSQFLAVVAYNHKIDASGAQTTITTRGRPAGAYRNWLCRQVWPGIAIPATHPSAPTGLQLSTGLDDNKSFIWAFIQATWNQNIETDLAFYQVGYRKWTGNAWGEWSYSIVNDIKQKITGLVDDTKYQVQIQAINKRGYTSGWSEAQEIVTARDNSLPDNVTGLTDFYDRGVLTLTWQPVTDARDVRYEIRKGETWQNATILDQTILTNFVAQGDGVYHVAALIRGNYSPKPASIEISGQQIIKNYVANYDEQVDDWRGKLDGVVKVGEELWLAGVGDIYKATDIYTLPDIYAYGGVPTVGYYEIPDDHVTDIGKAARCGIVAERTILSDQNKTNATIEMNLSDNEGVWQGWKPYTTGEHIGRKYKFRLKLTSDGQTVVRVSGFKYSVDVPDIIDSGKNVKIPKEGLTINFGQNFHAPPAVLVTILEAVQGDDAVITGITSDLFKIQILNADKPVERNINWIAQGY
jgi:hypothetical protein